MSTNLRRWFSPALVLALLSGAVDGASQEPRIPLNLDFSVPGLVDPSSPWGWFLVPLAAGGVQVTLDGAEGDARVLRLTRDWERDDKLRGSTFSTAPSQRVENSRSRRKWTTPGPGNL